MIGDWAFTAPPTLTSCKGKSVYFRVGLHRRGPKNVREIRGRRHRRDRPNLLCLYRNPPHEGGMMLTRGSVKGMRIIRIMQLWFPLGVDPSITIRSCIA